MSVAGAALAAVLCGLLGLLAPALIRGVPEPAEPADDKEPYAAIGGRAGLWRRTALAAAVAGALVGAAVGVDWPLLFLVPLVPVGVALALIDWRTRLLPTRLIAPTYALVVPLVIAAGLLSGERDALVRAGLGWLALGGLYVVLWLVSPRSMGYGDVRLSGVLGIVLGYLGWPSVVLGGWSAFLLGGLAGLVLVRRGLIDRQHNPFGPWMLIGALAGVVLGEPFGVWMWGDLAA